MLKITIIENHKQIDQFKEYINSINTNSNIALIYDTDTDGISAATLTEIALKKLNKPIKLSISKHKYGRFLSKELVEELKENNITHLIFVDLPAEGFPDVENGKHLKILVLDHHPITNDSIPENFTIIKPNLFQTKYESHKVCSANIVYNFFNELINMENYDWIASLGMIGDITYDLFKEFVDNVLKKYNIEIKEDIYDTELGKLENLVAYSDCMLDNKEIENAKKILLKAKDYKEAKEQLQYLNIVKEEIDKFINNFEQNSEKHEKVYFYEINPKYFIGSIVSTIISLKKLQNKVLIIIEDIKPEQYNINARCQDKSYNMGKMVKEVCSKLENAYGGGHIPAAGATLQKKDKEKFKQLVLEWINTEK